MMRAARAWRACGISAWLALLALSHPAGAAPVTTDHLGLDLVGNLEVPAGASLAQHGAILIVHDTLATLASETVATLQKGLATRGLPSLAITLSLGLDKRAAPYDCALEHDHRHTDAPDELAAWIAWLKSHQAQRVLLAGHGRGGVQVALLAARGDLDPIAKALVLAAPMSNEPAEIAAAYATAGGRDLGPLMTSARKQIDDGEGDGFLDVPLFLHCRTARVTAEAFLDYYDPATDSTTQALLRRIMLPTLIVSTRGDAAASDFMARLAAAGLPAHTRLAVVDGADVTFTGPTGDALARAVADFAADLPPQ